MGLSASMWAGVSGLLSHGERMNVVGNNIANVNTLGFKGQRMDFQDFIYQDSYSAGGLTQIGRGVQIGAVMGDFGQGSFETTTEVTDLAIGGRGFFKVKPQGTETEYYTRAGNFRFQNDGTLTNPQGYALQGWKIDNTQGPTRATGQQANAANVSQIKGSGLPTDVKLDTWSVNPLQTTKISYNVNLDKGNDDKSVYMENPFSSLLETWNGKQPPAPNSPPLAEEAYNTVVPIKVYDEAGGVHTLSMYIDKVDSKTYKGGGNQQVYEYVLTMDPAEDMRRAAVPNEAWKPGASTGLITDPADASSVFTTKMPNPPVTEPVLKAGYTLNTAYTFNSTDPGLTAVPPTKKLLDAFDAKSWPSDTFTDAGKTWPRVDASGNEPTVIIDMKGTKSAGVLMTGTLTFTSSGKLENMTGYVLNGNKKPIKDPNGGFQPGNGYVIDKEGNPVPVLDPDDPASYMYPTEVSSSGFPLIVGNFTGIPGADTVGSVPDADKYLMEVDFGLKVSNYKNPWQNNDSLASLKAQPKDNTVYRNTDVDSKGNPVSGPAQYTASQRVPNPNYMNNDPSRGPEYIYLNPYYDESLNTVTENPAGSGKYDIVIRSPKYLYPENKDAAGNPLSYLSPRNAGPPVTYDAFTWDQAGGDPFPPELDGIVSYDVNSKNLTWGTRKASEAILADARGLAIMTEPTLKTANAFKCDGSSNAVVSTSQNGYGRGELSSWTVSQDGVLSGIYSNGVTLPLYQVAIYDFTCNQGLRREGGNLFSETMESGQPGMGVGGQNGLGTVNAQTLEGSNVDLSREFVNMITTQRGFQSNSKIITTVDTMLDVVVNMKR